MSTRDVSEELVQEVAELLRSRYALDGEAVRELGGRLAAAEDRVSAERGAENRAFAERFTAQHAPTFDRLGR